MPFDPTKPVAGTPVDAMEMRGQLNGLKDLIDLCVTHDQMLISINQSLNDNSSANSNDVDSLNLTVSDPPSQGDVQRIADKLDELIQQLRR